MLRFVVGELVSLRLLPLAGSGRKRGQEFPADGVAYCVAAGGFSVTSMMRLVLL
jgi:hypothetical protein